MNGAVAGFPAPRTTRATAGWWLALAGVVVLAALASFVVMELPTNAAADVTHYKYWTHQIATHGVSGAYSGTYPETAAIYPPVTMYGYRVVGWLYRHLFDPSFDLQTALDSHALTVLVKLVAVVPHLVAAVAIFALLQLRQSAGVALTVTVAYALNPAAIFDAAFWGQPDAVHALFLLAALWCFEEDRPLPGFAFIGLAAATKPQAWALLPFLGYVALRRFGLTRTVAGGVVGGAAALAVCVPYLVYGTFGELLGLPATIAETMPVASANAHNVWWLVTAAQPAFVLDADPLLGALTYREVALGLALVLFGYASWRTNPFATNGGLEAMAAYLAFGWFLVTTRAHENHAFFVLPILAMAVPRARFLAVMFAAISATLLANMALHDFGLRPFWETWLGAETWVNLQLANAWLNVLLFVAWSVWIWPRWRFACPTEPLSP
ncbi:MAG: hypothetical protein IT305_29990 [Chloroflexi bacterium]|nr:hypothetical protein [Chloroflexota bacterium]